MVQREITVVNALGIHARPAAMIVRHASNYKSSLFLEKDGIAADAKSILNVMMLAAGRETTVTIRAEGPDEKEALQDIVALFEEGFGEE